MTTVLEPPAAPPAEPSPPPPGGAPRAARTRRWELLALLERKVGITPMGLAMIGAAGLMWALSRTMSSRGMALLAYGLLLVLLVSWTMGRRNLAIDATRSDLPTRISASRTVDAEICLTARRRASSIVVEDGLAEQLGLPVRIAVQVLPTGQDVSHAYSFTASTRGVFQVGPLVAEFSDPFGLTRRRQQIAPPATIIVHPRMEPVTDRITSREWEDPPVRPPVSRPWPTGFEFYGMREYQSGDDPRRIVWRALAQYDKYLVRESEQGITDRVNIYLDSDRDGHLRGDPSPTFETGVSVAASLAVKHLKDGFSVSLDINSARVAKSFRGSGKRIPILDELAAVQLERVPLVRALDRLFVDPQRTSHNILITPYLTDDSAARLRVVMSRGTSLILVLLLSEDTDPLTIHRATGLRCNVVEVHPGSSLQGVFQHVVGATRR